MQNWCSSCSACAQRKQAPKKQQTPLALVPVAGPFEKVIIDVVGPLPETAEGHKYILCLIRDHTKMVELHALPDVKAECVVQALIDWIAHYGIMHQLLSDMGANFFSKVTLDVCRAFGIEKNHCHISAADTAGHRSIQ